MTEELGHARQFAERIKDLYGTPPGSMDFTPDQAYLQPPEDSTDVTTVIRGVIETCDGVDWATQDMVIAILHDEENHMRTFQRYLTEFEN